MGEILETRNWPHAPPHKFDGTGTWMITAGTLQRLHRFDSPSRLDLLHETFLELAAHYELQLHAWSMLSNHYHFIAEAADGSVLQTMLRHFHAATARQLNALDETPGRQVWFQYWDSRITFQRSWLARLKYVHNNAVKHGRVTTARDYKWCSAAWFESNAPRSLVSAVARLNTDTVNVFDPFD